MRYFVLAAAVALLLPTLAAQGTGIGTGQQASNNLAFTPEGGQLDYGQVGLQYWWYPGFEATDIHQSNPDKMLNWRVVSGALPPGLKLIPDGDINLGVVLGNGNCAIAGYPLEAGTWVFAVECRDNFSGVAVQQEYSIVVLPQGSVPLKITTGNLAVSDGQAFYDDTIYCTSVGVPPYSWSWYPQAGSQLPPGLSLDTSATGVSTSISGTPTQDGEYHFVVRVDHGSNTDEKAYRLVVGDLPLAIVSPSTLPSGTEGYRYVYAIEASQGFAPYRWVAGNLPTGWILESATGLITAEAPAAGVYTFDMRVYDSRPNQGGAAATVTKSFSVTIDPPGGGTGLSITTPANLPVGDAGMDYSTQLSASGGTAPYVWSATGLPTSWTLDQAGMLSAAGTDVLPTNFSFTATVADSTAATQSRAFYVVIDAPSANGGSGGTGGCVAGTGAGGGFVILLGLLAAARRRRNS